MVELTVEVKTVSISLYTRYLNMTLLEIKAQIIDHFTEFDLFQFADFEHIELDEETEDWRDHLVSLALRELESDGLCIMIEDEDRELAIWILTAPIEMIDGNVNPNLGRN